LTQFRGLLCVDGAILFRLEQLLDKALILQLSEEAHVLADNKPTVLATEGVNAVPHVMY
jgi:hypothetical protein